LGEGAVYAFAYFAVALRSEIDFLSGFGGVRRGWSQKNRRRAAACGFHFGKKPEADGFVGVLGCVAEADSGVF